MKTDSQIIAEAHKIDPEVSTVLEACEALYLSGTPDDVSGNVEAPCGHFYRVARWIVTTDSQGFTDLNTYQDESEALEAFERLSEEYQKWDDSED